MKMISKRGWLRYWDSILPPPVVCLFDLSQHVVVVVVVVFRAAEHFAIPIVVVACQAGGDPRFPSCSLLSVGSAFKNSYRRHDDHSNLVCIAQRVPSNLLAPASAAGAAPGVMACRDSTNACIQFNISELLTPFLSAGSTS